MTQTEAIPTGYKKTEIGVIPEDWEVELLGELFNVSGGFAASREQLSDVGFCYLHYGDIHNSKRTYIDVEESYSEIPKLDTSNTSISKSSLLNDGDVVFVDASEDDEGASKHIVICNPDNIPYISGLHTIVLKSKDTHLKNIFKQYCFQAKYIKDQIKFYAVGTKVTGISKKNIAKIKIFFPTKNEEQQAIAQVLSDTDALIESLEKLIAKKKAIKQGAMQQLLTGKKRLPGFIGEWKTKELNEIGNTYGGLSGKTINDFQEGTYPYIPFLNIMNNPVINIHSFDYVNIRADEKQNNVIKGDLFFNGSSETPEEVGMCSVLLDDIQDLYLNSFCFGFRLNRNLRTDGLYLSYFFRSSVGRKLIFSLAQGATRYNLSKISFMKLKIPYPNPDEQTAIADILSDMDSEIEKLEQKRDKFILLKQGMMQQLLTGKIRLVKNGDN